MTPETTVRQVLAVATPLANHIGLRPHIERAFEQERVSLDFAGFSGETLQGVVQEPPAL
jgi:hypothetical protein